MEHIFVHLLHLIVEQIKYKRNKTKKRIKTQTKQNDFNHQSPLPSIAMKMYAPATL